MQVNYSLYLVTSRDLLPSGKDYLESLEEAIQGGVTIVQIREKLADTAEFIKIASASKVICDKYNIPLIINDRVDVAKAMGAHGVHLGQTDMSPTLARTLLPPNAIIGVSCSTLEHVHAVANLDDGVVDYIGIGAVWDTKTKKIEKERVVGVRNVGGMLDGLGSKNIKTVAIGGIKATNLLRTLHGSVSQTGVALSGVAVVSDIVASSNPQEASRKLRTIFDSFQSSSSPRFGLAYVSSNHSPGAPSYTIETILDGVESLLKGVKELKPLIHQITNTVVANQSANVTLALGASPIMASAPEELEDLARICGAILINIGTLTSGAKEGMLKAGTYGNKYRKPVVFDPVGIGATKYRQEFTRDALNEFQATVIKGNAGEIAALAGSTEVASKGVDSVGPGFRDPVSFVKKLALRERCIVVMTGPIDYLSDGHTVVSISNGHEYLEKFTGSGCIAGSSIATFCAVAAAAKAQTNNVGNGNDEHRLVQGDMLVGAIAGILALTVGAELVMEEQSGEVKGPASFLMHLIDELGSHLDVENVRRLARITVH